MPLSGRYFAQGQDETHILRIDITEDGSPNGGLEVISGIWKGINWIAFDIAQTDDNSGYTGKINYQYPKLSINPLLGKDVFIKVNDTTIDVYFNKTLSATFNKQNYHNNFGELIIDFDWEYGFTLSEQQMIKETITEVRTLFRNAGFVLNELQEKDDTNIVPSPPLNWSDALLNEKIKTFWDNYAEKNQWGFWVFFAKTLSDSGKSLGGIMFDSDNLHGENRIQRQGCCVFVNSFIKDYEFTSRKNMLVWCTVHEMGHCFNLLHAWQKEYGTGWLPLKNDKTLLSFMNYPFVYSKGEPAFWSNFKNTFSYNELLFLRHAPRRFVQPGAETWGHNHAIRKPTDYEVKLNNLISELHSEVGRISIVGRRLTDEEMKRLDLLNNVLSKLYKVQPFMKQLDFKDYSQEEH